VNAVLEVSVPLLQYFTAIEPEKHDLQLHCIMFCCLRHVSSTDLRPEVVLGPAATMLSQL